MDIADSFWARLARIEIDPDCTIRASRSPHRESENSRTRSGAVRRAGWRLSGRELVAEHAIN